MGKRSAYTEKQGEYLTFIDRYTRQRGCPPSEVDIQKHFGVSAPLVHQMIVRLERSGLIEKIPYTSRSIRVLLPEDQMPAAIARAAAGTGPNKARFTKTQGQYLAFIHHYFKVHGFAPSEGDIQMYFRVSAPSVHTMVVKLTECGFIDRVPYTSRSIRLLVHPDHLPLLE